VCRPGHVHLQSPTSCWSGHVHLHQFCVRGCPPLSAHTLRAASCISCRSNLIGCTCWEVTHNNTAVCCPLQLYPLPACRHSSGPWRQSVVPHAGRAQEDDRDMLRNAVFWVHAAETPAFAGGPSCSAGGACWCQWWAMTCLVHYHAWQHSVAGLILLPTHWLHEEQCSAGPHNGQQPGLQHGQSRQVRRHHAGVHRRPPMSSAGVAG
jgi:hypothetical protein